MRGRTVRATVITGDAFGLVVSGLDGAAADYVEGRLRVLEGPNAGIARRIVDNKGAALVLDEALGLAPGTRIQLWEGCDKRFVTCRTRFANAANFRGEPHVPGGDVLMRFGGG